MRTTLRSRLLVSHLLVAAVGVVALVVVAAIVTNVVFRGRVHGGMGPRMGQGGGAPPNSGIDVESALSASLSIALPLAAAAAIVTAGVAALIVARRISQPVEQIRGATHRMARGEYRNEVPLPADAELAGLASDVNALGARLADSELHRTRLIGEVAHEMRTPLTTIRASMEGLIDGVMKPDPTVFANVASEASRLHRLADDLTLLSQTEERAIPLRLADVDLRALTRDAMERLRPQYEDKGVALVLADGPTLPARADADRIAQILTNLLGNALTHTPAGGTVSVHGFAAPDGVAVEVTDTGRGIAPDHLDRVFERFYRVPDASHPAGRGIGLTIARGMARAHGGDVTATSDGPGLGSSFRLSLPA